jgi:predicted ThiF/HesA family dinucleotide-utilizing enzyme
MKNLSKVIGAVSMLGALCGSIEPVSAAIVCLSETRAAGTVTRSSCGVTGIFRGANNPRVVSVDMQSKPAVGSFDVSTLGLDANSHPIGTNCIARDTTVGGVIQNNPAGGCNDVDALTKITVLIRQL